MISAAHAACDAATAHATATAPITHRPRFLIVTTILASSLAFIDGSVVNVGLPAIGTTFGADAIQLQWVVNAYLLPLSALLLLGGAAGDIFGRRRALIIGVTLFGLSSVACAIAPSIALLLAARSVQGASAALLMPNSLVILGMAFAGEAKGRAIGVWAAAGAVAGAIGPVLGGWLIDVGSWRLIFVINVPIAIIAIWFAFLSVRKDDVAKVASLDGAGALLATIGLGLATWALTESSSRGVSALTSSAFALGFMALIAFVLVERRRKEIAMMPLALFGSSTFVGLTLLTLLLYAALGGLMVLLPYVLITSLRYSATQAAAALLPLAVAISLISPIAASVAARTGARPVLIVSPLIVAGGFLLTMRIASYESYWVSVFPSMIVIALGMAGAVAPLTTAVLSSVDAQHTGSASGFNSAVARTGGLIATALIGSVMIASGPALGTAFDLAAIVGAATCVAASLCAFFWINVPSLSRGPSR
jgi:EmrB/QacA subfamily drug resistance transporter